MMMPSCRAHPASASPFGSDPRRWREDFPVLHQTVHDRPLAYLDSAATSQKPVPVILSVCDYYGTCNANVHRAFHFLGEQSTQRYEAARSKVAGFFHARSPREIIFTRGATEAINLVAHAWGRVFLKPGDAIMLTEMEHHSNLVPWQQAARATGARLKYIPVLPDGTLDRDAVERILREHRVRLVALTHQSNVLGTVNPVREIAAAARHAGARVLVDGAQSAPHGPLDVPGLGADFYVCSAHKMCGPTGAGALWAPVELQEQMEPFLAGGEMIDRVDWEESTWAEPPHKFEAGTPPIAEVIGMGAAAEYLTRLDASARTAWERGLTEHAMGRLREIPGLRIFGEAPERGGAVSFAVPGVHPHDLAQWLDGEAIAVRAGHLCCQPLMRRLGVPAVTRASFLFYNTPEEADRLVEAIIRAREYFGHGHG